jgi:hypothetical protein
MLSVGVERHDKLRSLRQGVCYSGLQCCTLTKIYRMPHHNIAGASSNFGGGVGRSIVNHHHAVTATYSFTEDARYHAFFVVGWNYDPRSTIAAR